MAHTFNPLVLFLFSLFQRQTEAGAALHCSGQGEEPFLARSLALLKTGQAAAGSTAGRTGTHLIHQQPEVGLHRHVNQVWAVNHLSVKRRGRVQGAHSFRKAVVILKAHFS